MIRPYRITAGPSIEPVTLDEIKDWLGVDVSNDDAILSSLIKSGREQIEKLTGRVLIEQTIQFSLPDFSCLSGDTIYLPVGPVLGVTSITYTDAAGTEDTVFDSSKYVLRDLEQPPEIVLIPGESWPQTYSYAVDVVTVTLTCGYGSLTTDVPDMLREAIKWHVKKHYDQEQVDGKYIDMAIVALTNPYVAWWA